MTTHSRVPAALARSALAELISASAQDPLFTELLARLIAGPGRVLDPGRSGKWVAYVTEVARALGGDPAIAVRVAVTIACVVAAADVVDDLADDEWAEGEVSAGRGVNAAVALYALAQRGLGDVASAIGATRAVRLGDLIAQVYLLAAAGEDADLRLEADPGATAEAAHAMTARKAGALVALACQAGALTATEERPIIDAVGEFGTHAGIVAQIRNDIAGLSPERCPRSSDLRRRKKTLPVVFALRCAHEEGIPALIAWYDRSPEPRGASVDEEEATIARLINDLGGARYAALVAEVHRREARAALQSLMRLTGRTAVGSLRRLVPPVWQADDSAYRQC